MTRYFIEESPFSHFFTADTRSAPLWLVVRVYVGWLWLSAGWEKLHTDAWVGTNAGAAMKGFVSGALKKTAEFCPPAPGACHPDVQGWYATFLQNTVLNHAVAWSYAITAGEMLVGIGLILGCFVGLAAFF